MAKSRVLTQLVIIVVVSSLLLIVYWVADSRCGNAPPHTLVPIPSSSSTTTRLPATTTTTAPTTVSTAPPVNPLIAKLMGHVNADDLRFYQCALDRFRYDGPPEEVIPVAVVPLTIERSLFRTLLCNLTASFRHLVVIVNGVADDVGDDIKALQLLLPADHFHVYWKPEVVSFSSCVNIGFYFALNLPFDEAPYVMVFNSDTRYSANYLNRFARHVRQTVLPDKPLLEQLTQEVQNEIAAAKKENRTTLRTLGLKGLSQSVALPDRLRYGDPSVMRSTFANHTSVFTHVFRTMCSFAVSRLAIATVGTYDENFFPAYGEDYDWVGRADLMGFGHWEPGEVNIFGSFQHILNGMLGTVGVVANRTPASIRLGLSLRNMIDLWMVHRYSEVKWAGSTGALYAKPYLKFKNTKPFQATHIDIPLDAWVLDEEVINRIKAVGYGFIPKSNLTLYNMSLLLPLNISVGSNMNITNTTTNTTTTTTTL